MRFLIYSWSIQGYHFTTLDVHFNYSCNMLHTKIHCIFLHKKTHPFLDFLSKDDVELTCFQIINR